MLKLKKSFAILTALVGLLAFGGKDALAAKGSITGSLPKDLSTGVFNITVTISDITQAQKDKGDLEPPGDATRLASRLKLYLNDNSTALPFVEDTTGAVKFFVRETSPMEEEPEGLLWKHTYSLEIVQTTSNALASEAGNGAVKSVNMKFSYNLGGAETEILPRTSNFSIIQDSYVINKAPEFEATAILGGPRSLTVYWKVEDEVDALSGTTATKKKPTKMLVFLIDSELVTSAELSASKYSGSATADTPTTCQLNLTSADNQDCITCAEGVYLNEAKQDGVTFRLVADASDGKASFVNLENKRRYFAVMQYEPDGVKRSQCVLGIPTPNISMTELNGAGEATVVDFRCFIATAAYGSEAHEELKYFRKFRDEVLMQTSMGKDFVNFYYRVSPPAAEFIAANPILKNIVQSALYVPLQLLKVADPWY